MEDLLRRHNANTNRAEDGTIINECSVGMNAVLNRIVYDYGLAIQPMHDYYIINILTIIRNNYDKKLKETEMLYKIDQDIRQLKLYLTNYLAGQTHQPLILFYLPIDYVVGKGYERKLSPRNQAIADMAKVVRKMIPNKLNDISQNGINIYTVVLDPTPLPVGQIKKYISKLSNKGTRGSAWLLSHCPLDLHLHRLIPKTHLMESFTGEVKLPIEFGQKLFKNEDIPLNQYTHVAFGDGLHVRPLLKTKKQKDAARERADRKNWKVRTESEIMTELTKCGIPSIFMKKMRWY